jgi:hypothetical protein
VNLCGAARAAALSARRALLQERSEIPQPHRLTSISMTPYDSWLDMQRDPQQRLDGGEARQPLLIASGATRMMLRRIVSDFYQALKPTFTLRKNGHLSPCFTDRINYAEIPAP